jgi:RluA family pseudouridine synthase
MIRQEEIDQWLERIEADEASETAEAKQRKGKIRWFTELAVDDHLLAVDKSSGISVIPERDQSAESLQHLITERYGRVWTVHRIDKGTSGVVLFARDEETHRELNRQFRDREVEKEYLVLVEGEAPEEGVDVDIPLGPAPGNRMKASAAGQEAVTRFEVEERFRGFTLLRAYPTTGRQHQIRVHAGAVGLPLLVDPLYGQRDSFLLSSIKRKYRDYGREERPLIDRLTLHAARLVITDPGSEERLTFKAELPKDFRAALNQLRKLRQVID